MPVRTASRLNTVLWSPPFSPRSLPSLVLWLDASRIPLADGDSVTTWSDLSGQANDATQSTAAKKPLYKVNIVNGKPVVRFDGVDDYLATGALSYAQPNTILIVAKTAVPSPTTNQNICDGIPTSDRHIIATLITTGGFRIFAGTLLDGTVDRSNVWAVFAGIFNGTSSESIFNGVSDTAGNAGTQSIGGLTIGANVNQTGDLLNGDIGEFLVYNRALLLRETKRLVKYLGQKWGIGVS